MSFALLKAFNFLPLQQDLLGEATSQGGYFN